MKILAFSAHPDDVEIACAGTLIKYKQRGDDVYIIHACSGDKGNFRIPPQEMKCIRSKEGQCAGDISGIEVSSLEYPDAELEYSHKNLYNFVTAIRKINPDVIITHTPDDYHIDHSVVSKLVVDASFLVTIPYVEPDTKAMSQVPQIYFMEPYTGISFLPHEYVDITDTLALKLKMMTCHTSQLDWLKEHDGMDILNFIQTSAEYRGFQCGVKYAESFTRYITALRAKPGYFLP